ncbi:glycosyl transferase [Streptomyces sp. Ru71]|uniref:glycosyltransferase family 9 protein n=1 Tax=Streptomyces sp. Ru71 TaxID=2080746 RepID=UPI000CDDFDCD|nr:glycosyltransferase family 9 protein [Streptomyces sp. Ru71]POX45472.1 glycosyl transferase [Streptomyces sp. Ru71]
MTALVVRLDGFDGVLLAGPAVRAVAARTGDVTLLCTRRGAPAARLLPHVRDVVVWEPAGDEGPRGVPEGQGDGADGLGGGAEDLVRRLRAAAYDTAVVLTPYGHSPLPVARLLRSARRAAWIGADGDEPAGVLDVCHRRLPGRHEAEAALDTAAAMGFRPRTGDDGRLRVLPAPDTAQLTGGNGPYVVLHPGAAAGSPEWGAERCAQTAALLADAGHRVAVTGTAQEAAVTRRVAGVTAVDLGGRTSPRTLVGVVRGADCVLAGDADIAHLAAAVGTPVVSLPSKAAPAGDRAPYKVPSVLFGDDACPGAEHEATPLDVVEAVRQLLAA